MVWSAQKLEAIMPDTSQLLSDEPEMESFLHYMQMLMLVTCLEWLWRNQEDFFYWCQPHNLFQSAAVT